MDVGGFYAEGVVAVWFAAVPRCLGWIFGTGNTELNSVQIHETNCYL
jgi:hypothetical protein